MTVALADLWAAARDDPDSLPTEAIEAVLRDQGLVGQLSDVALRELARMLRERYQAEGVHAPRDPRMRWLPTELGVLVDRRYRAYPHLRLIDAAFVEAAEYAAGVRPITDWQAARKLIEMPPQHGKTLAISYGIASWIETWPDDRVTYVTYSDERADEIGAAVRDALRGNPSLFRTRVRRDTSAKGYWKIEGHYGGLRCVGATAGLTGFPSDLAVVDDLISNRKEAESPAVRKERREVVTSVVLTRLSARAPVLMIGTPWHADDPLAHAEATGDYEVIRLDVYGGPDDPLGRAEPVRVGKEDPQGRPEGMVVEADVLCPELHPMEQVSKLEMTLSAYEFSSLYRCRPVVGEGMLFAWPDLRYYRPARDGTDAYEMGLHPDPAAWNSPHRRHLWAEGESYRLERMPDGWTFATADLAYSKKTAADWTVVSVWRAYQGGLLLLDRDRARIDSEGHWPMAARLRARWGFTTLVCESRHRDGKIMAGAATHGVPVDYEPTDVDKVTRAIMAGAPAMVRGHKLLLPADAPWLREFEDELVRFPVDRYDDQVDTLSLAAAKVTAGGPAQVLDTRSARPRTGIALVGGRRSGIELAARRGRGH